MSWLSKSTANIAPPFLLGIIAFLTVVGFDILNVMNISWIIDDDQWDIYLSTIFFQDASWTFPVGINKDFGIQIGTSIAFNASGLALISKLLVPIIGQKFQLIGYWLLACFIFQSYFSWKILNLFSKNKWINLLCTAIILFVPPMLMRLQIHVILVAHFLIIWALYLIFSNLSKEGVRKKFYWTLLLCIAVAVHFYIFFIVGLLWSANLLDNVFIRREIKISQALFEGVINTLVVFLAAWQIGYFVMGGSSSAEYGFGFFRTHLLSFFDSDGWSYILPKISTSQIPHGDFLLNQGTYEGLSFLGSGILFLVPFAIFGVYKYDANIKKIAKRAPFFLLSIIFCAIFSLSNNITLGKFNFYIHLPEPVFFLASVLRSSGRLIWPVYYLIVFMTFYGVIKYFTKKYAGILLAVAVFLQIVDTSSGWLQLRKQFLITNAPTPDLVLRSGFWVDVPKKYTKIYTLPLHYGLKQPNWKVWSFFSANKGLTTNAIYQGRADLKKIEEVNVFYDQQIASGKFDHDALYIIDDDYLAPVSRNINRAEDLLARIDDFNILAPGWFNCKSCFKVNRADLINSSDYQKPVANILFKFGKDDIGASFLLNVGNYEQNGWGWSYPEDWGVWSEGRQAKIIIPYPEFIRPEILKLRVKPFIASSHPYQTIEIWLNGRRQKSITLTTALDNEIPIILPTIGIKDYALIEFKFPNAVSPTELGLGSDNRKLAIGLVSGIFQ